MFSVAFPFGARPYSGFSQTIPVWLMKLANNSETFLLYGSYIYSSFYVKCFIYCPGSQKSTSSKSSYGSTESDYYYAVPQYGDLGTPTKPKPLDIIKEYDTAPSDWSSDTGSGPGYEVIKLERVRKSSRLPANTFHQELRLYQGF